MKHVLESLTLHSSALMWVMSTQGIKKRECDEPGVGRGLLEDIGREQCRSLRLERGRRPFCQMKGGSCRGEGFVGLTGSKAVQGHEVWVQPCLQHSKKVSPLF